MTLPLPCYNRSNNTTTNTKKENDMYNNGAAMTGMAAAGTLAATGATDGMPWIWVLLGAFALAAAAGAAARIAPKPQA